VTVKVVQAKFICCNMKKEKNSVSPASQAKSGLSISVVNNVNKLLEGEGGGGHSPPPIKSDPDAPQNPLVNGENNVNSNNCDNSTPGTPTGGGQGEEGRDRDRDTPSSLEEKKPVLSGSGGGSGPPSNCNPGNGVIKSETDTFLDTFDSKDGVKEDCSVGGLPFPEDFKAEVDQIKLDGSCDFGNGKLPYTTHKLTEAVTGPMTWLVVILLISTTNLPMKELR